MGCLSGPILFIGIECLLSVNETSAWGRACLSWLVPHLLLHHQSVGAINEISFLFIHVWNWIPIFSYMNSMVIIDRQTEGVHLRVNLPCWATHSMKIYPSPRIHLPIPPAEEISYLLLWLGLP